MNTSSNKPTTSNSNPYKDILFAVFRQYGQKSRTEGHLTINLPPGSHYSRARIMETKSCPGLYIVFKDNESSYGGFFHDRAVLELFSLPKKQAVRAGRGPISQLGCEVEDSTRIVHLSLETNIHSIPNIAGTELFKIVPRVPMSGDLCTPEGQLATEVAWSVSNRVSMKREIDSRLANLQTVLSSSGGTSVTTATGPFANAKEALVSA